MFDFHAATAELGWCFTRRWSSGQSCWFELLGEIEIPVELFTCCHHERGSWVQDLSSIGPSGWLAQDSAGWMGWLGLA